MKKHIIIIAALLGSMASIAQDNMTQSAVNLPQSLHLNPAQRPDHGFISMPLFGSFGVSVNNSFSYNDIITSRGNSKYIDTKKLLTSLTNSNQFLTRLNMDIVNLGFYVSSEDFIGVTVRLRAHASMTYPKGLFAFVMDNPLGTAQDFNISMSPNAVGWGELGLSYSRPIGDNFTIGARVKYLMGLASLQSGPTMNILVENDYNKYVVSGDYSLMAGNIDLGGGGFNNMLAGIFSNPGVAVDLGVTYLSDDGRVSASASVSDLGAIWWNSKGSSILRAKNPGTKFEYDGLGNLVSNKPVNFGSSMDSVLKGLINVIGVDTLSKVGFSTMLPTTFQAMGAYSLGGELQHNLSLGFIGSLPYRGGFEYAISAGYAYRSPNRMWQLMANYTYASHNPLSVGLGAVFSAGVFQLFVATDNVLPYFSVLDARGVNARLGINFFFGRVSGRDR